MDCTWTNFEITTYDIIEQINKGNLFAKNANWKELVRSAVIGDNQKDPLPFCFTLLVNLSDILHRDERVDALHVMEDNMALYLQDMCSPKEQDFYIRECRALAHYFKRVRDLIAAYEDTGKFWRDNQNRDQPTIEAVIYFNCLNRLDADEYLAYVQAHYEYIKQSNSDLFYPHYAPTHSFLYYNRLILPNAIELSKAILMAENTRFTFLSKEKPSSFVTIQNVDLDARNRCFDKYIQTKANELMKVQIQNNDRLYRPTETEILKQLLNEEEPIYDRLKGMRNFKGSSAYEALWKPGTEDVLKMTKWFIAYLNDKIKSTSIEQPVVAQESRQPEEAEIFAYIHYSITDKDKQIKITKSIKHIVSTLSLPQIGEALREMKKRNEIYYPKPKSKLHEELKRMGLPDEYTRGFSIHNFKKYV